MNRTSTIKTVGPLGREEEIIVFSIDDVTDPFVFRGIIQEKGRYTFSAWVKGTDSEDIGIAIAGRKDYDKYTFIDSEWVKVIITLDMEPENLVIDFEKVGAYLMFKPQLERGDTATDYAPSPDDFASMIEASSRGIRFLVKSATADGSLELTDKALEVIAQNIMLTGTTTFRSALTDSVDKLRDLKDDLAEPDASKRKYITEIDGNIITTGVIRSVDAEMDEDGVYTKKGVIFDLDNETFITPNLRVHKNGNIMSREFLIGVNGHAEFSGELKAASGTFAGKLEGNEIHGATITGSDVSANVMTAKDKYLIHNESGEDKEFASTNNPDDKATGMWDTLQIGKDFNFIKLMGLLFNRALKSIVAQDWTIFANTSGEHSGTINGVRPSNMQTQLVPTSVYVDGVPTSTWTEVHSITLEPGTYLVKASCGFAANATGRRAMSLSDSATRTDNSNCMDRRTAVNGGATTCEKTRIVSKTTDFTLHVLVWQNSGGDLGLSDCYISYVKLL